MIGSEVYHLKQNWLADINHYLISEFAAGSDEATEILSKNENEIAEMFESGESAYLVANKFSPHRSY